MTLNHVMAIIVRHFIQSSSYGSQLGWTNWSRAKVSAAKCRRKIRHFGIIWFM